MSYCEAHDIGFAHYFLFQVTASMTNSLSGAREPTDVVPQATASALLSEPMVSAASSSLNTGSQVSYCEFHDIGFAHFYFLFQVPASTTGSLSEAPTVVVPQATSTVFSSGPTTSATSLTPTSGAGVPLSGPITSATSPSLSTDPQVSYCEFHGICFFSF